MQLLYNVFYLVTFLTSYLGIKFALNNSIFSGLAVSSVTSSDNFGRSPGLRKKLLTSQVRKHSQQQQLQDIHQQPPQLLQPKPYNFASLKRPTRLRHVPAHFRQSKDDFFVLTSAPRCDATDDVTCSPHSLSASSDSQMLQDMRAINRRRNMTSHTKAPATSPAPDLLSDILSLSTPVTDCSAKKSNRRVSTPLLKATQHSPEFV